MHLLEMSPRHNLESLPGRGPGPPRSWGDGWEARRPPSLGGGKFISRQEFSPGERRQPCTPTHRAPTADRGDSQLGEAGGYCSKRLISPQSPPGPKAEGWGLPAHPLPCPSRQTSFCPHATLCPLPRARARLRHLLQGHWGSKLTMRMLSIQRGKDRLK